MRALREIAKHNWDFCLYETEEGYALNVAFYGVGMDYTRNFRVSEDEAHLDFESLKQLSQQIRDDYTSFKDREISARIER